MAGTFTPAMDILCLGKVVRKILEPATAMMDGESLDFKDPAKHDRRAVNFVDCCRRAYATSKTSDELLKVRKFSTP